MCLEETTNCDQWFCWCHVFVFREVIPCLRAGDRKRSATNSRQKAAKPGQFRFTVFCVVCFFSVVFSFCIVCIFICLLSCIFQNIQREWHCIVPLSASLTQSQSNVDPRSPRCPIRCSDVIDFSYPIIQIQFHNTSTVGERDNGFSNL